MERSERDMSLKNPVTSPAIDPGTVRLVAQRLNHYATPGPTTTQKHAENRKHFRLSSIVVPLAFLPCDKVCLPVQFPYEGILDPQAALPFAKRTKNDKLLILTELFVVDLGSC